MSQETSDPGKCPTCGVNVRGAAAAGFTHYCESPRDEPAADVAARLVAVSKERDELARRCERQAVRIAQCQQLHL